MSHLIFYNSFRSGILGQTLSYLIPLSFWNEIFEQTLSHVVSHFELRSPGRQPHIIHFILMCNLLADNLTSHISDCTFMQDQAGETMSYLTSNFDMRSLDRQCHNSHLISYWDVKSLGMHCHISCHKSHVDVRLLGRQSLSSRLIWIWDIYAAIGSDIRCHIARQDLTSK